MPLRIAEKVGQDTLDVLAAFGEFWQFVGRALAWLGRGSLRWKNMRLVLPQMYEVGFKSVPVIGITGAFIGMVLAIEAYTQFRSIGQENRLGGIINVSVVKQIGPVLAAVMLAGRVGGALTAELGTMNVTEQLDALRVMGADPIRVLVVPRFLACIILLPILTIYSDMLGVIGGWLVSALFRAGGGQLADLRGAGEGDVLRRGDRPDQLLQGLHLRRRGAGGGPRLYRKLRDQLHRDHRAELFLREGGQRLVHRDLRHPGNPWLTRWR